MPNDGSTPTASPASPPRRRWLRIVGFVVGLAFLAAAIATAIGARADLDRALAALRDPPPAATALVLLSVAASVFLSGWLFDVLTKRFGSVPFWEMQWLIAAASLANYLPLKPGFIGRVAYLSARHGIRPADSIRTIVEAIGLSATSCAGFLAALAALRALGIDGAWALAAPLALVPLLFAKRSWWLARALVIRQCEIALWTLRYWAVFRLVGAPVGLDTAVVLGSVSVIASLVPFVSNGLGIREWTIGLLAPLIAHDPVSTGQAIVAELVHRVAELAVITPLGLLAFAMLARIDLARTRATQPRARA